MLLKLNPCATQIPIIAASISRLAKNTGIVILVGIAARFTMTQTVIAANANGHKIIGLPASIIARIVRIVNTQP